MAGRKILLTRHNNVLYAMDSHCYHMGHPLLEGDLEDVASVHPCIVCPAHRHRVSSSTTYRPRCVGSLQGTRLQRTSRPAAPRWGQGTALLRLQIDMRTGRRVETDLCGGACTSADQKQRIYQVFSDGDKIQ